MQYVLRMQLISPLPKYVKQISTFLSLCNFALDNAGTEMLKHVSLAFIFYVADQIQYYSRIAHPKSASPREYSAHKKKKEREKEGENHYYVPHAITLNKFPFFP